MTYEDLLPILKSHHLTRIKQVVKNEKVVEFHIDCSPLLKDPAMEIIRGITDNEFNVSWFPNNDCIVVKKKL